VLFVMESATRRAQPIRHGERSVAIHDCECWLMDCRATLAVTKTARESKFFLNF